MRILFIISLTLIGLVKSYAQGLYGRQWVVGEPNVTLSFNKQANNLYNYDFNSTLGNPPYNTYKACGNGVSSICDSATGLLQFYTNGIYMYDANAQPFHNSDSLISQLGYNNNTLYNNQGALILPKANKKYDVFFPYYSDTSLTPVFSGANLFLHHVVDMNANAGAGSVIKKQEDLLKGNGHLSYMNMDAVRHAKGVDWWILKTGFGNGLWNDSLYFYTWLVKQDTIKGPYLQYGGVQGKLVVDNQTNYRFGQLKFSIDGTKFVGTQGSYTFYYGNFNRCTGIISDLVYKSPPWDSSYVLYGDTSVYYDNYITPWTSGINFSPNNKFIYMCAGASRIWQYEYTEPDSAKAWYRVARIKDTTNNLTGDWGPLEYTPDSTLLLFTAGTLKGFMSGIQKPDIKGFGCRYKINICSFAPGQIWPYVNQPASHPNYNLGIDSSGCWPLSNQQLAVSNEQFSMYPNPANTQVLIDVGNANNQKLSITNTNGQVMHQQILRKVQTSIDVSRWVRGVYVVKYMGSVQKLIIE